MGAGFLGRGLGLDILTSDITLGLKEALSGSGGWKPPGQVGSWRTGEVV